MSWIGHLWNGSVADRLGWTLVHSLWQGALVALLFAGLRSLTRWRSSNARYVLACAMLCLISAAPIFTFFDLGREFVKTPGADSRAASLLAAHLPALPRSTPSLESGTFWRRSEEHTSELQSHVNLVCRLLLEKKKQSEAGTDTDAVA